MRIHHVLIFHRNRNNRRLIKQIYYKQLDHIIIEPEKSYCLLSTDETQESQWCNSVQVWEPESQEQQGKKRGDGCFCSGKGEFILPPTFCSTQAFKILDDGELPQCRGKIASLSPAESNGSFIQGKMTMPLNNFFFILKWIDSKSTLRGYFLLSVNFPYSQWKRIVFSNISNLSLSEM